LQANFVVLGSTDTFWNQTRRLNHALNVGLPLSIAVTGLAMGVFFGSTPVLLIASLAIGLAVLAEPRVGLYMLATAIALDPAFNDPITEPFFKLFNPLPNTLFTPVEILTVWTTICWGIRCLAESQIQLPDRSTLLAGLCLTLTLVFGIVNGVSRGGDFGIAVWETRALFMLLPVTLLTCGLLRERRHVIELIMVLLIGLSIMGLELLWRYVMLIKPSTEEGPLEQAFSHDGAMLVSVLCIAAAAAVLWGPNKRAKMWGVIGFLVAASVVLASRRRAAVIGMEVGLLILGVTLVLTNWRRFAILAPIVLVVGLLYMGAFWNNNNALGQPVRAFRTVFISDSKRDRDRHSDVYRATEKLNLWFDIQASPITGTGFGKPFAKPIPMINFSSFWPLWDYIPHNTVLWLWLKGGPLAIMAFWFLVGTVIAHGVRTVRKLRSPVLTALIGTGLAFIIMSVMFAYVDLGLTSPRIMITLALALGILAAVDRAWPNLGLQPTARKLETK
jgi:hypothetical protein